MRDRRYTRAQEAATDRWLHKIRTGELDGITFDWPAGPSAVESAGPDTQPMPAPQPEAPCWPLDELPPCPGQTIADSMIRGWHHLYELRCAGIAAAHATPIPCGDAYHDDAAVTFRALRLSAAAQGWRMDWDGNWHCRACAQQRPGFRTLYPLAVAGSVQEYEQRTWQHHRDSHGTGKRARLARAS